MAEKCLAILSPAERKTEVEFATARYDRSEQSILMGLFEQMQRVQLEGVNFQLTSVNHHLAKALSPERSAHLLNELAAIDLMLNEASEDTSPILQYSFKELRSFTAVYNDYLQAYQMLLHALSSPTLMVDLKLDSDQGMKEALRPLKSAALHVAFALRNFGKAGERRRGGNPQNPPAQETVQVRADQAVSRWYTVGKLSGSLIFLYLVYEHLIYLNSVQGTRTYQITTDLWIKYFENQGLPRLAKTVEVLWGGFRPVAESSALKARLAETGLAAVGASISSIATRLPYGVGKLLETTGGLLGQTLTVATVFEPGLLPLLGNFLSSTQVTLSVSVLRHCLAWASLYPSISIALFVMAFIFYIDNKFLDGAARRQFSSALSRAVQRTGNLVTSLYHALRGRRQAGGIITKNGKRRKLGRNPIRPSSIFRQQRSNPINQSTRMPRRPKPNRN